MDDPLSTTGNHLTREIKAAFCDAVNGQSGHAKIDSIPRIYSGAAGLGSRDVRPSDIIAAFDNMSDEGADFFCLGLKHSLALERRDDPDLRPTNAFSMRGHSVGGFGSVTTNKVIATIAGQVFGKDVQAYPKYGSEKKGLPTTYYLTIADSHIYQHSELEHVDLIVLNDTNALFSGNPLGGLLDGSAIFMQSHFTEPGDVWARIPADHRRTIREKKLRVYYADMVKIAREVATVADLEMRMQGIVLLGAFLKLTPLCAGREDVGRAGLRRSGRGAAKVLWQARRAGGAGQSHLREARLQRITRNPPQHHRGRQRPHPQLNS